MKNHFIVILLLFSSSSDSLLADRNGLRVVPTYLKPILNYCRSVYANRSLIQNGDLHGFDLKNDFEVSEKKIFIMSQKISDRNIYFQTTAFLSLASKIVYDVRTIMTRVSEISVTHFQNIFMLARTIDRSLFEEVNNIRMVAEYEWYIKKGDQVRDELRADNAWQQLAKSNSLEDRRKAFEILLNKYLMLRMSAQHYPDLVMPVDFKLAEIDIPRPISYEAFKSEGGFKGFMLAVFFSTATNVDALPWTQRIAAIDQIHESLIVAEETISTNLAALGLEYGDNHRHNPYPTPSWRYTHYIPRGPE